MQLGFRLSLDGQALTPVQNAISVVTGMFAAGEQGAWYDPSDLSTLFQDSAGTTPVTAVEQPVGLMLDKRFGAVRGAELVANGKFDTNTVGWTPTNATLSAIGGAMRITAIAPAQITASTSVSTTAGRTYEVTGNVVSNPSSRALFLNTVGGPQSITVGAFRTTFVATAASTSITPNGASTFLAGEFFEVDNISVREIAGNHATQATAINRPVLKQANGKYYLAFNGTNSSMSTAAINFTGTDKMTVCAGVRKLSDATIGIVAEISVSGDVANAGSFYLRAPFAADATFGASTRGGGSSQTWRKTGLIYPAPVTAVISSSLTTVSSTAAQAVTLRVNATNQTGVDSGNLVSTGNYGNYPLYIGARAGTSLFFNGNLYGLIIRGAASSTTQIAATELWMNNRTGAY